MESNKNLFRTLFGHAAIYGISSVGGRFINYLLVPYHTRIFGPATYGIITDFYALTAVLQILLTLGLETGFFRFASKDRSHAEVFSNSFLILFSNGLLFLLFSSIFLHPIAGFLGYSSNPEYVFLFVLILFFDTIVAIPFSKLRLDGKALEFVLVKSGNILINVALNFVFLSNTYFITQLHKIPAFENSGLVVLVFIANLIASLATLAYFYREFLRIKINFNYKLIKEIITYSLPLMIGGLAGIVNDMADRFFIKYMIPPEQHPMYQLGIYGGILKISILLNLFIQVYRFAAEPLFFTTSESKGSRKFYADSAKYFFFVSLLIFLFISFYISYFEKILGGNYRSGIGIVPILLLSYVFFGFYFNLSVWFKLTDRTRFAVIFTVFGLFVNILINYFTVPIYGFYGSAWARLVSYFVMVVLSYIVGQRIFPVPYDLKRIFEYFALSIALFFLSRLMPETTNILFTLIRFLMLCFFLLYFLFREVAVRNKLKSILLSYGNKDH
ncbi:MAG TPA: oligosaccharide flippase family protein [Williamwhitmania sp.]|nr:oligosaccharide flippase family protein [Williamwhitmania sp.]